jgi:cardiolipin synthase
MTIIRVAIPVVKGKRRFHLDKGRPWSVVEHALLAAVVTEARAVDALASQADLPRRLVLEILIRLMRAGWIVLDQGPAGVTFSASAEGKAVVDQDELPSVRKRIKRWMNFVVDRVTGTVYRSRELPFYEKHVLQQRAERERLVWMEPRDIAFDGPASLVSTLLADDEKFIEMEPAGDRPVDRYALVTVHNGKVDGLPTRAPGELSELVLQAARNAPREPAGEGSPTYTPAPPRPYKDRDLPAPMRGIFEFDDLILGGKEHEEVFLESIRRANRRLIIHSTFIAEAKFALVRPLLHDAVKRGVLIDILWGEDDEKTDSKATNATVRRLRQEVAAAGHYSSLRLHSFSTRSHSKIIVADDGSGDRFFAVVGSCNWLSSGFESFEASVRLRDPQLVAGVLDQLAELTCGSDGHWTELTNDIARMANESRHRKILTGARAELTIVLGPQHAQYVREARDRAVNRLFVTSHRFGSAHRAAIIVPAIAAAEKRGIQAKVYYGMASGNVSPGDAIRLTQVAAEYGVQIRPVREPRLHGKILAWDDDSLLLTSQNWLSADPSEANLRREIGVFIRSQGAARYAIERFEMMRRD